MRRLPELVDLTTPFEGSSCAWDVYPRPQLYRNSYLSLNGAWELSLADLQGDRPLGEITVPFPPESRISGIARTLQPGERYVYRRRFSLPEGFVRHTTILHFGAADQIARVWLNGTYLGDHEGGYLPFEFDVSSCLCQENELTVEITDELDRELSYGKQRRKRGGMWYTPISGLWQSVWMESVPKDYIRSLRITPTLNSVRIELEGGAGDIRMSVTTPEGEKQLRVSGTSVELSFANPRNWTPEDPYLYRFVLASGEDRIASYFALRTVACVRRKTGPLIELNGKPYFFHGLLDQGYFPDGIYTPASPEGYRYDVRLCKELGFNMLRKHIKVEPEIFYFYCDLYGVIVFQDLVNSGHYSYLFDTVLPTVGLKRSPDRPASPRRRAAFEAHGRELCRHLYNHPCVCYYTIFNEGWGQYGADRIYRELSALDPTRVWDTASGWFVGAESDVVSHHVYSRPVRPPVCGDKPVVLSEFGGYSCPVPGHCFNRSKNYGYTSYETVASFSAALERLYTEQILPAARAGLCACVLTQLSDVEDETNGLVTYDRRVVKVSRERMLRIAYALQERFLAAHSV